MLSFMQSHLLELLLAYLLGHFQHVPERKSNEQISIQVSKCTHIHTYVYTCVCVCM